MHKLYKKSYKFSDIFFIPPYPIKRTYNSKGECEYFKMKKNKNLNYIKYIKKITLLLNDENEGEYDPSKPNDFEAV